MTPVTVRQKDRLIFQFQATELEMAFEDGHAANLALPDNFSGIVRLFPLPNLVLFPGVVQALHIFEPRYRKMIEDSLAGDQTIAMCLPKEDSGKNRTPEIHDVICIGKIVAHAEVEDGRYNLLLQGVARAKIIRELNIEQPYRMAEVEILADVDDADLETKTELRARVRAFCEKIQSQEMIETSLEASVFDDSSVWNQLPIGLLIDLVCFSLPISSDQRQKILEAQDVVVRGEYLLEFAQTFGREPTDSKVDFPPRFSSN